MMQAGMKAARGARTDGRHTSIIPISSYSLAFFGFGQRTRARHRDDARMTHHQSKSATHHLVHSISLIRVE
jgi:hypothetical protein